MQTRVLFNPKSELQWNIIAWNDEINALRYQILDNNEIVLGLNSKQVPGNVKLLSSIEFPILKNMLAYCIAIGD